MFLVCQPNTFLNYSVLIHYYESELTNSLKKYLLNNRVHDLIVNEKLFIKFNSENSE